MIREATPEDIRAVVLGMRPEDAEEHFACRFSDDRELMAAEVIAAQALAIKVYAVCDDAGAPVSMIGAYLTGPGVAALHRVSTASWPAVSFRAWRFFAGFFIPAVLRPTIRRAEVSILAKHARAIKPLLRLGFAVEGYRRGRGKNGEDFIDLAWINRVDGPACALVCGHSQAA